MNRKQEQKVEQVREALASAPTHAVAGGGKTFCGVELKASGMYLKRANDGGFVNSVVYFSSCWRKGVPNLCPSCIEALGLQTKADE